MKDVNISIELKSPFFSVGGENYWDDRQFKIIAYVDGNYNRRVAVGEMHIMRLNVDRVWREECSMYAAFDDYSIDTYQYYKAIFDEDGSVKPEFRDEDRGIFDELYDNLHVLSRIEISAKYKGYGIAGAAVRIYLENFASGSDVVYCQAFPLQYEGKGDGDGRDYKRKFDGDIATCQSKLCKYYESMGMRRIGKTEHFFFKVDDFLSHCLSLA